MIRTSHGVTLTSAFRVFLQAKSMIIDAHRNLSDVMVSIEDILGSSANELGFLDKELSRSLNTFRVLGMAWLKHSEFVISSGLATEAKMEMPSEDLIRAYEQIEEIANDAEKDSESNLVVFPIEDRFADKVSSGSLDMDMTDFLSAVGFNLERSDYLSMEEAIRILMSAKAFMIDAFENARRADNIMNRVLDASDEMHAMLGDDVVDEINRLAGINRGWIMHVGKTVIGKKLILDESFADKPRGSRCHNVKNCVSIGSTRAKFTEKTNIRKGEATVHSLF